jgi:eukaryotic-like serine/threonine-protein kinase
MTILVTGLEIGALLGAGHYREVYLAKDAVHGHVAAKMMSRLAGESDNAWQARREGLLQEAQRLSAATHRNVVQVYGCMARSVGCRSTLLAVKVSIGAVLW